MIGLSCGGWSWTDSHDFHVKHLLLIGGGEVLIRWPDGMDWSECRIGFNGLGSGVAKWRGRCSCFRKGPSGINHTSRITQSHLKKHSQPSQGISINPDTPKYRYVFSPLFAPSSFRPPFERLSGFGIHLGFRFSVFGFRFVEARMGVDTGWTMESNCYTLTP